MEAIGSYKELLAKPGVKGTEAWTKAKAENPELIDDLCVHKPYIDEITYDSPFAAGAHMRRVPDVIDCWYDSGAMPFAQWGYPQSECGQVQSTVSADFISEALDQTRGWFYSQLAISTLLFGPDKTHDPLVDKPTNLYPKAPSKTSGVLQQPWPHPFKNCIVLGLMVSECGSPRTASSLSFRGRRGEDAGQGNFAQKSARCPRASGTTARRRKSSTCTAPMRCAGTSLRTNRRGRRSATANKRSRIASPSFLLRLWNVYSFFTIYANIDGFDPGKMLGGDVGQLERSCSRRPDNIVRSTSVANSIVGS